MALCLLACGMSIFDLNPTRGHAAPIIDNNAGLYLDALTDTLGTSMTSGISTGPAGATVSGCSSAIPQSASFTTVEIAPTSFGAWDTLTLDGTFNGGTTNMTATVLASDGTSVLLGPSTAATLDLSAIAASETSIFVQIDLTTTPGEPCPNISELGVSWDALSVIGIEKTAPPTVVAGEPLVYDIRYSVSHVDAQDLILWDTLPSFADGTLNYPGAPSPDPNAPPPSIPYAGQNDDPVFVAATGGGMYHPGPGNLSVVSGSTTYSIPPNSVYWVLDEINSGTTSTLQVSIAPPNGTVDGTELSNQAHAELINGQNIDSQTTLTIVTSDPDPTIDKAPGEGIFPINDNHEAIVGSTIRYLIEVEYDNSATGDETMYQTQVWDDLSDICTSATCPGAITAISGAGTFDPAFVAPDGSGPTPALVWPVGTLTPGSQRSFFYDIDLTGVPGGTVLENTICVDSDQTEPVCDTLPVTVDLSGYVNGHVFGKGDDHNGLITTRADQNDDHHIAIGVGDSYNYHLRVQNGSAVTLHDVLMWDRIPDDVEFLAASLPALAGGTVYYTTNDTGDPLVAPATTPPLHIDDIGSDPLWTSTPPSDPSTVRWVAFVVPTVPSQWFAAPGDPPSRVLGEISVRVIEPAIPCEAFDIENRGNFKAFRKEPLGGGAPVPTDPGEAQRLDDLEITRVEPTIAVLDVDGNNVSLTPLSLTPPAQLTYTLTIENEISITHPSDTAEDVQVALSWNPIPIGNALVYPTFAGFTSAPAGAVLDPSSNLLAGLVVINIGTLVEGESVDITMLLNVPDGELSSERVTIDALATARDDVCTQPIAHSSSITAALFTGPQIQVVKNDILDIIPPGTEYNYELLYNNIGTSPSTGTFIVDDMPDEVVFLDAELSNGEVLYCAGPATPGGTFPPTGCSMPPGLSPAFPVDIATIASCFQLGIAAGTTWTCPQGELTEWVAFLIDDPTLTPPQLPVNSTRSLTMRVRNDEDTDPANQQNSAIGVQIRNAIATFSNELLYAVANQVITTVAQAPGIEVIKTGPATAAAGEPVSWLIDYSNNSGVDDTTVTITELLPAGVTLVGVNHTFNALAQSQGATSGTQALTVSQAPDGSFNVDIAPGLRAGTVARCGGRNPRSARDDRRRSRGRHLDHQRGLRRSIQRIRLVDQL